MLAILTMVVLALGFSEAARGQARALSGSAQPGSGEREGAARAAAHECDDGEGHFRAPAIPRYDGLERVPRLVP